MKSFVARWIHFFFRRQVDLSALALCRICFGSTLFFQYVSLYAIRLEAFGAQGISAWFPLPRQLDLSMARGFIGNLTYLDFLTLPAETTGLYLFLLFALFCYTVGFRARLFGFLALFLHILFCAKMPFALWGWGEIIKSFMFYTLLWPGLGQVYSVNNLIANGRRRSAKSPAEGPIFYLRALQAHVIVVYLIASWSRLDDPNWLDGTEIYGVLTDTYWARINSCWRYFMPFLRVMTYLFWATELTAPFGLMIPRLRKIWIFVLLFMHVSIEGLMMVGYWNLMMMAGLSTFLPYRETLSSLRMAWHFISTRAGSFKREWFRESAFSKTSGHSAPGMD